ncbi:hypothetical protein MRB53_029405 [Persea americana]|uniref:Uncharacterized protein n=1 Tax=Persea americana TaxID=3435 RepID=A0ACC2KIC0_PERAE|nr:hypothetical protein MRB53_029405 [Persea americana]
MAVDNRDAYGFAVRPQHLQTYREHANIYKEEEEVRLNKWKKFLERLGTCNGLEEIGSEKETPGLGGGKCDGLEEISLEKEVPTKETEADKIQTWSPIRPALGAIEYMMSFRVKKMKYHLKNEQGGGSGGPLASIEELESVKGAPENELEEEFYNAEKLDLVQDAPSSESLNASVVDKKTVNGASHHEPFFPWKEDLECLVRGGVPKDLRGELWQAFVGVRACRVERYYQDLLAQDTKAVELNKHDSSPSNGTDEESSKDSECAPEKWKGQIEKDLPRTFPGHPALGDDGRNALRRLLTAYALHNPSVGYCQAMNFFAGLLLLLMPEENAFWTLMRIIDDYFDGYYSEEMIESQVDQLVFEELVHERFPNLVNHLDSLGVQLAWVTGPWFLSIFVNMLPWESVLRVWDVILFEGNRVMLFRAALALMEIYGPALVTAKDAGDAVTLLQSLAGSTFDSSQLVLTACTGYQAVSETSLKSLREKHRPAVLAAVEERAKGLSVWKNSQGLASKLYGFKHDPGSFIPEKNPTKGLTTMNIDGHLSISEFDSKNLDGFLGRLNGDDEVDSGIDLQEQVVWLKVELCKLLEQKKASVLRAEELETTMAEMVKQDNRRQLSSRVEQLEREVAGLQQALANKQKQEHAVLQVLMRVEQEQRSMDNARRLAEQDAAAQRYAAKVLKGKYEDAMASLAKMEKKVVMAETALEATLQYQSSQFEAQQSASPSPRSSPTHEQPTSKLGLLSRPFVLGWRDKTKVEKPVQGKPYNVEVTNVGKPSREEDQSAEIQQKENNNNQEETGKDSNENCSMYNLQSN